MWRVIVRPIGCADFTTVHSTLKAARGDAERFSLFYVLADLPHITKRSS